MGWLPKRSTIGICLTALGWTAAARAQEVVPEPPPPAVARPALPPVPQPPQGREMNQHLFMPSELVVQPFVQTWFRSTTAMGVVRSNAPALSLDGGLSVTREDFQQVGYSQLFELQVKLLPWLAVRANAAALVFTGTSGRSLLNVGSTALYGAGGGITIGHRIGKMVQIAAIGDAAFEPTYSVDIGGAIVNSVRERAVNSDLVSHENGLPVRAGVAAAVAPLRALGFQASARYEHAFRLGGSLSRQDAFVGAGAVDFDLRAISAVPIGFVGAYQVAIPFGAQDRDGLWHYLDAGIFYTGRHELALGLEASARRFPLRNRVDSDGLIANVVIRYYWE